MTKQEYLAELRRHLAALPAEEVERTVAFYAEAIEDRMEAGASEGEAVADLEAPASVAERLVAELPAVPRLAARFGGLGLTGAPLALVICAVILGSPLWVCLLAAGIMVVLSVFLMLAGVLVGCWAISLASLVVLPAGLVAAMAAATAGTVPGALAAAGLGLLFGGAGLLGVHLCCAVTWIILRAMGWLARKLYSLFARGGEAPAWRRSPMKPAWRIVHLVALAMIAVGAVLCLVAWGMVGFDHELLAVELNRCNEVIPRWFGPHTRIFSK